jgi:nitrogenase molybdenum-iron protein alpha/beta subunit
MKETEKKATQEKQCPWDKVDRNLETWEIARDFLEMRKNKQFELVSFKDIIEKCADTAAAEWWEKVQPGYGSGLWCPIYYAISVAGGVRDAVVVIHGAQSCVTAVRHFFALYGGGGGGNYYWGSPFTFAVSTDLNERDNILGAPEKLKKTLLEVDEIHKPEVIFVAPTCGPGMIGEPIEEVIEDVKGDLKHAKECVYLDLPGFKAIDEGDMMRETATGYWTELMHEPKKKVKGGVNVIGDYRGTSWEEKDCFKTNFPTTFDEIGGILKALDLKLHVTVPQSSLEDIRRAPEAEFNIVNCPMLAYPICEEMEEKFGIPWSPHVYPLGKEGITSFIMAFAKHFGKEKQAQALIDEKWKEIEPLWEKAKELIKGKTVLMDSAISMTSVNRQLGYARMLQEMGAKDIVFFNIMPSEILGRREGVEYYLTTTAAGEPFNPQFLWWPAPHAIKLSPIEVADFLGLKDDEILHLYGDLGWYTKAPRWDASNIAQVQSSIHFRRRRNVCQRSIFFSGTRGLLVDIINAIEGTKRKGHWTLYSRILGKWPVPAPTA